MRIGILFLLILILCAGAALAEDTITITTYYPSPYGSYNDLSSYRMKIGQNYSLASTAVATNDLIVEGNIGVGTTSPRAKLEVVGGARVGYDSSSCSSSKAGTLRYNPGTNKMQYCNSTEWVDFFVGTCPCYAGTGQCLSIRYETCGVGEGGIGKFYQCTESGEVVIYNDCSALPG